MILDGSTLDIEKACKSHPHLVRETLISAILLFPLGKQTRFEARTSLEMLCMFISASIYQYRMPASFQSLFCIEVGYTVHPLVKYPSYFGLSLSLTQTRLNCVACTLPELFLENAFRSSIPFRHEQIFCIIASQYFEPCSVCAVSQTVNRSVEIYQFGAIHPDHIPTPICYLFRSMPLMSHPQEYKVKIPILQMLWLRYYSLN